MKAETSKKNTAKPASHDPRLAEAISLLPRIPADEYAVWFETGCALKKLGAPYEVFRDWSSTSDKFDEGECEKKWGDLPDEPLCGISTIRRYAGVEVGEYHSTFVPPPENMLSEPATDDDRVRQAAEFVCTLFRRGEFFELCGAMSLKGRVIPDREDDVTQLDEETTVDDLCQAPDFRESILTPDTGLYVGLNPVQDLEGTGHKAPTDAMVTDYRLALLECDEMSVEEQWAVVRQMRLPVVAVTFSGGKSLHILVRVDAGNDLQLYKKRVATLHELANACGFKADPSCRNPSRLTRLPGAKRGGDTQRMVSLGWGYPDWASFAAAELTPTPAPASVVEAEPVDPEPLLVNYNEQGKIASLNQHGFAHYAMRELNLINAEGGFWRYEPEKGLWDQLSPEQLNDLLVEVAHQCRERFDLELARFMTASTCRDLRAFMPPSNTNPFVTRPKRVIHVANGMLEIGDDGTLALQPFAPEYYSRNRCAIAYDSDAQCPRFLSELLGAALPPDDIELLQRYAGQCLLGENHTQTLLILTGTAGGGKGTIVNVLRKVIGGDNVVELRTSQLGSRFEYGQFIGKTLLIGSDVRSDFLLQRGASHIKSLCGGDPLTAEIKGVTGGVSLKGSYNIVITANDRPLLNIDGDTDAWRRRVLWIPFERPRTANPIPNFDQLLLNEEGPGILNWMIEGAVKVLNEGIPVHTLSAQRLDLLLRESDSIYGFLSEWVEIDPDCGAHDGLTCERLQRAYERWCEGNGYTALPVREAARKMKETIGRLFRVGQSHDLMQHGQYARGYHGLRPRRADCPAQPVQQVQQAQPMEEQRVPVVELRPVPRVREATPPQPEEDDEDAPPAPPVPCDELDEDNLGIVQPEFGF